MSQPRREGTGGFCALLTRQPQGDAAPQPGDETSACPVLAGQGLHRIYLNPSGGGTRVFMETSVSERTNFTFFFFFSQASLFVHFTPLISLDLALGTIESCAFSLRNAYGEMVLQVLWGALLICAWFPQPFGCICRSCSRAELVRWSVELLCSGHDEILPRSSVLPCMEKMVTVICSAAFC